MLNIFSLKSFCVIVAEICPNRSILRYLFISRRFFTVNPCAFHIALTSLPCAARAHGCRDQAALCGRRECLNWLDWQASVGRILLRLCCDPFRFLDDAVLASLSVLRAAIIRLPGMSTLAAGRTQFHRGIAGFADRRLDFGFRFLWKWF